jgi:pimeloyl-ACP methyl ester carboxylesterase
MRKSLPLGEPFAGVTLSYLERGEPAAEPVLCVHGLTRNAHDFDPLAEVLAAGGRRVIAVDVVGRGQSSWLADPSGYAVPVYAGHLARLIERLELGRVDWVGTSMGGLIGILLASTETSPIRRLVLNDIGPFVALKATQGIRDYLGLDLRFAGLAELEAHLRQIHAGFGPLTDAEWRTMAERGSRRTAEGWRLSYDPAIRAPFLEAGQGDVDLWELWDRIRCPTFVLRGADSPLLTPAILEQMRQRGPRAEAITLTGIGHAPALSTPEQIGIVTRWLGL